MVYASEHDWSETIALNRRQRQPRPLLWQDHVPPPGAKQMRPAVYRDDQRQPRASLSGPMNDRFQQSRLV